MTDREFIARLVDIRHQQGLSGVQVAERMFCTSQNVSIFETGKHSPRLATILRYAAAVGARITVEAK